MRINNIVLFGILSFLLSKEVRSQDLSFVKTQVNDSIQIDLVNYLYSPVRVRLKEIENKKDSIKIRPSTIIPPLDTVRKILMIYHPRKLDSVQINPYDYAAFTVTFGDPSKTKHNNRYRYALPYKKGRAVAIMQTWNGKVSHRKDSSRYAIDFSTQIGDTITAAREGIVIKIKDKFKEHGGIEYFNKANYVVIMHNDGTLAEYIHLDYKGSLVVPGARVKVGQPIGISGWTGYSTKPHLHFVVKDAEGNSLPIYFKGYGKKVLKRGNRYWH